MRQATRALGWATTILWIAVAVFMGTCLYSAMEVVEANMGSTLLGVPAFSSSNGAATVSIPFYLSNTGFYDISDLNISTRITESTGKEVSSAQTQVALIAAGDHIEDTHNISIGLAQILSENLTYLLFNSGNFSVEFLVGLRFAYIFPFQLSVDTIMPWGAPFSNLSIGEPIFDLDNRNVTIPYSFRNDSPYFDILGTVRGSIYDRERILVGSGLTVLDAGSNEPFAGTLGIQISPTADLPGLVAMGRIRLRFETAGFSFDEEISWGGTPD